MGKQNTTKGLKIMKIKKESRIFFGISIFCVILSLVLLLPNMMNVPLFFISAFTSGVHFGIAIMLRIEEKVEKIKESFKNEN